METEKETSHKWNNVYSKHFNGMWYPDEEIVRFAARHINRRVGIELYEPKRKTNRILDAGCGIGRHVMFFAEQGFDVYGTDISEEAIEIGKAWAAKHSFKVNLKVDVAEKLNFDNGFFDLVVSTGVLDHIRFSDAKKAIKEISRVLAPKGCVFISLRSTDDSECGRGEKVDKNSFILQEGYEKGIIQHYFDLEELVDLFDGFKIFDVELSECRFPGSFGVDKAFLQTSSLNKKYIDLSKENSLDLKDSRWYVAAEKV
ncbi:MAG: methyltransferase type 11 [Candidatus Saganbacteria bacterium]|uniref:Methyltransferase type 11 n=1 Tax=Candidatus Saganbacteria bacterium TaxID=2575572 RepID=A0A833NZ72_UNCSA|nr:MAG: methyltransferase type 11 [Candidatus Saganbacteria bacterium]